MTVGLVVVSHSAKIAEGVVELAGQMAEKVRIQAAGGADDGGIGTDATMIAEAITAADEGEGVLVLVDLGSAVLSAQLAIDELVGTSAESWEQAAASAVETASQTLRDLRIAEVVKLDLQLEDGQVRAYRVRIQVSFKYERGGGGS